MNNINKHPLVSVIMGAYNCADTLEESVRCIQIQTYDNWELIICDDASTDDTSAVIKRLASKDSRIKFLKNKNNLTLAPTLNRCLKVAQGEYIARMDADDICTSDRFSKEVNFLNNNPQYAIVSTQMEFFDENGVFRKTNYSGEVRREKLAKSTQICHATCMVRKEAYMSVGGYSEKKSRKRVEDWDLWIRMLASGYRAYVLPEILYSMRDDTNSINRKKYQYRINEARVSAFAIKELELKKGNYKYILRPLIIGLLPKPIYKKLHKKKRLRKY